MQDLTIIIVNWNTGTLLRDCLQTAIRFLPAHLSWEIVVVDNASTDGSETAACGGDARVRLIKNKENVGFARANNQAIRATRSRYVLLLNPNTVCLEDCIGPMVARLEQDETIGMVACRLLYEDRSDQRSADLFPRPLYEINPWFQWRRRRLNRNLDRALRENGACDVETLIGAFQLMPRPALERAGLLDETLFMYAEDLDLCRRIRILGLRVVFDASVALVHLGGRSSSQVWSQTARLTRVRRSIHQMQRKHFGPRRAAAALLVRTLIGWLRYLAYLTAFRFTVSQAFRRSVLADAVANGRALAALIAPNVESESGDRPRAS